VAPRRACSPVPAGDELRRAATGRAAREGAVEPRPRRSHHLDRRHRPAPLPGVLARGHGHLCAARDPARMGIGQDRHPRPEPHPGPHDAADGPCRRWSAASPCSSPSGATDWSASGSTRPRATASPSRPPGRCWPRSSSRCRSWCSPLKPAFGRRTVASRTRAATLGANRWTTFRRVTIPMVAPSLFAGLALAWARALGEFRGDDHVRRQLPRHHPDGAACGLCGPGEPARRGDRAVAAPPRVLDRGPGVAPGPLVPGEVGDGAVSLEAHIKLRLGALDLDAEIAVADGEVVAIVGAQWLGEDLGDAGPRRVGSSVRGPDRPRRRGAGRLGPGGEGAARTAAGGLCVPGLPVVSPPQRLGECGLRPAVPGNAAQPGP